MIPLLGAVTLTLHRYGATTVVDYRAQRPAPVASTIRATVAPTPKSMANRLPNGVHINDTVTIATYDEVRGYSEVTGELADRIQVDGVWYEVHTTTKQPTFMGQPIHWEALAIRVQSLEVPT